MDKKDANKDRDFKLGKNTELRFEVGRKGDTVRLSLVSGQAEMFGTELAQGREYVFSYGAKVAVFTWHGCSLALRGQTQAAYVAQETPMIQYLNTHGVLEQLRENADKKGNRGPIVMVAGPMNSGKSTLCRILLNYAARSGGSPVYIDVDVGRGNVSMPGSLGALLVERAASVEEDFSQVAPLVYHFGHTLPTSNINLYNMLISRLAERVDERFSVNKNSRMSGAIINTYGGVKGDGYKMLTHVARAFEVDVILVLDQERLYSQFREDMPSCVKTVYLHKSGGVVDRTTADRAELQDMKVREYFYGPRNQLFPHSFDVPLDDIRVFKIGAPSIPESCMPMGMKAEDNMTKLVPVPAGPALLHHILAVSFAKSLEEDVIQSNVAGFICVTGVDEAKKTMTVLSPQPRPIPPTILLISDIQFMDTH